METTHSPPKRTLLVVDGSYLLISSQKMKLNINYNKLVQELERKLGCEFYEKWFINGEGSSLNQFYNTLRAAPPAGPQFRVKLLGLKTHTSFCKHCRRDVESKVQKGVDVSIATLVLKHAFKNLYDQVVLIAGDGDFHDALATVKDELGKDLVLVGFQDSTVSLDLQQIATKVIWLNTLADQIREGGPAAARQPQQVLPPVHQHILQHQHQPQQQQPQPQLMQQQMQQSFTPEQAALQQQLCNFSIGQPIQFQQNQPQQTQPQQTQQIQPQQLQQTQTQQAQKPQQQMQPQPQPRPPQQSQPQQQQVGWACSQCTFYNTPSCRFCDMCSAAKPTPTSSPAATPSIPAQPNLTPLFATQPSTQTSTAPKPVPTFVPAPLVTNAPTLYPTASIPYNVHNVNQTNYNKPAPAPVASAVPPHPQQFQQQPQPQQQQQQQQQLHQQQQLQQQYQPQQQPISHDSTFKLPPVASAVEKVFPCPVCTFHRMANSSCEMCGYNPKF